MRADRSLPRAVHPALICKRCRRPRLQSLPPQPQRRTYRPPAVPPPHPLHWCQGCRLRLENDNAASTGAPGSSDRGIAWPNPNTTSPPDFAAPRLPPTAAPAHTAAAEVLPAGEPIRGQIPVPRQRPAAFAVSTTMAAAASGPVPLPRARPAAAPAEAANPAIEPAYGYRPGLDKRSLEHDPEKACPGLDPGWYRFSEKIMLKQQAKAK